MPDDPSDAPRELPPCPSTPNCVSTEADDEAKRMEPIPFAGSPQEALERLVRVIGEMRGGQVVERSGRHLRAEFTTSVLGFVDDVDLLVDAEASLVRFRSASRTGHWDLGVNRRRMEELRRRFGRP